MAINITEENILNLLRTVEDPDLHRDLVSLNMVKEIKIVGNDVAVTVELTTPACPMKEKIKSDCEAALRQIESIGTITINLTANVSGKNTPGNTGGTPGQQAGIPGVKNVIAVSSGKGGVGKSTVSTNLAVCLMRSGAKVGLMDADAYGPNIPQMLGVTQGPATVGERIIPPEAHGIKTISVAMMTDPNQPIIWRGPMLHSLISQFINNVDWGELDYLVVDMPPGTGDAQLSLTQQCSLAGAVMVTTPQQVANSDVRRGIMMFHRVEVPILGLVENMAYFICPDNGKKYNIFGSGGGERLAQEAEIPFLGRVPIDPRIVVGGDTGNPIVLTSPDCDASKAFQEIAESVAQQVSIANANSTSLPVL